jgi:hypothetical protein
VSKREREKERKKERETERVSERASERTLSHKVLEIQTWCDTPSRNPWLTVQPLSHRATALPPNPPVTDKTKSSL